MIPLSSYTNTFFGVTSSERNRKREQVFDFRSGYSDVTTGRLVFEVCDHNEVGHRKAEQYALELQQDPHIRDVQIDRRLDEYTTNTRYIFEITFHPGHTLPKSPTLQKLFKPTPMPEPRQTRTWHERLLNPDDPFSV